MKNFRTYAITALVAGSMSFPLAAAHAEGYGKDAATSASTGAISSQTFKALDTDKSGTLSEAEFSKYSGTTVDFGAADVNGDGRLTLSEVKGKTEKPAQATGPDPSSTAN